MIKIEYKEIKIKSFPFPLEINLGIPENKNDFSTLPVLYFLHGGGDDHSFLKENLNSFVLL